jgi:DNA-binding transcriptional MerR regulator
MTKTFALVDLEELTGAKRFALQFWAKKGILQPTQDSSAAGRGVHRRFDLKEVEVAAMLGRLARYCNTEALRQFAKKFRARASGEKFEQTQKRELIEAARQGDPDIFVLFLLNEQGSGGEMTFFRWNDGTPPGPPRRLSDRTDGLVVNLARAWSRIPRGAT